MRQFVRLWPEYLAVDSRAKQREAEVKQK